MKSAVIAVAAALLASVLTYLVAGQEQGVGRADIDELQARIDQLSESLAGAATVEGSASSAGLTFSGESEQDAWLRGTNRDGSPRPGPADDQKPLADASNSMCFLTKVEIEGMDGPEDRASCFIALDEFTNWWEIHATQGDGTDASVYCNARCLVWE